MKHLPLHDIIDLAEMQLHRRLLRLIRARTHKYPQPIIDFEARLVWRTSWRLKRLRRRIASN